MAGLSWSHATESSPCCTHFSSTPIAIRPLKRRPGKLRRSPPPVRALLPQPLSSIVDTVAGVAAISSLGLSALPLLTGKAVRANRGRPVNDETEEEDFSFGVMTGVSFLPYANWTAWVLRAIEDQSNSALYYAVAALYAVPWIAHDLRLDGFTTIMLLLGAANVKIESMAATEAVEWRVPGVSEVAAQVSRSMATPARAVADAAQRKQLAAGQRQPVPGQEDTEERLDPAQFEEEELKRWDEAFRSRDTTRDRQP